MFDKFMAITGFILTIASAIYAVWVYRKTRRNVALLFKKLECYTLFEPDVNRLNIELSYNNQPIRNNLILLKACLQNTGQADIDSNSIFKPVKIITKQRYKWLEARQISVPEGASTSIEIVNDTEIEIRWDLLKSNEIIEFECLVEIQEDTKIAGSYSTQDFINSLQFDYRITDLRTISKEKQEDVFAETKLPVAIAKVIPWLLLLFSTLFIWSYFSPGSGFPFTSYEIRYSISDSGHTKLVTMAPSENRNHIELTDENGYCRVVAIKDFNAAYHLSSIHDSKPSEASKSKNLVMGLMFLLAAIGILIGNRKYLIKD